MSKAERSMKDAYEVSPLACARSLRNAGNL
jgi:hypothetical protein